jgi:hypothetical protein
MMALLNSRIDSLSKPSVKKNKGAVGFKPEVDVEADAEFEALANSNSCLDSKQRVQTNREEIVGDTELAWVSLQDARKILWRVASTSDWGRSTSAYAP